LFYTVASMTYYFLGSMDHLLARPGVVSATNKDSINAGRCVSFYEMLKFNSGSFMLSIFMIGIAIMVVVQDYDWQIDFIKINILKHALFSGPPIFLGVMAFISPIILNPYILGWPFLWRRNKKRAAVDPPKYPVKKEHGRVVDINTFMATAQELDQEMERVQGKPDVELGSLATKDLNSHGSPMPATPKGMFGKGRKGAVTKTTTVVQKTQLTEVAEVDRDPYGYPTTIQEEPSRSRSANKPRR
jgi:hypothetical protein